MLTTNNLLNFKRFIPLAAAILPLQFGVTATSLPAIAENETMVVADSRVIEREYRLPHRFDFGGVANTWDRYRLRISGNKMKLPVKTFIVRYSDDFNGKFKEDQIKLLAAGEAQPLLRSEWYADNSEVWLELETPLPADTTAEIVFSNVTNPNSGTYYFDCMALEDNDAAFPRYLGTWVISID